MPPKRKKGNKTPKEKAKRVYIREDASSVFLKAYQQHEGNWELIEQDKDVILFELPRKSMQNHIKYLRRGRNAEKGQAGSLMSFPPILHPVTN
jgi:hypothetical protein